MTPESIVSAFGAHLATGTKSAPSLPLPPTLEGTTVKVKDAAGVERPAPLFYVSPTQVNYEIPAGTAIGIATITITAGDNTSSSAPLPIVPVAPGVGDRLRQPYAQVEIVERSDDRRNGEAGKRRLKTNAQRPEIHLLGNFTQIAVHVRKQSAAGDAGLPMGLAHPL